MPPRPISASIRYPASVEPTSIATVRSSSLSDPRLDAAPAGAEHAQPGDAPVLLGQVGLLLDEVLALLVRHPEEVADALAVGERVVLDLLDRADLVGVDDPGVEQD